LLCPIPEDSLQVVPCSRQRALKQTSDDLPSCGALCEGDETPCACLACAS
jgi:hypothetical protein